MRRLASCLLLMLLPGCVHGQMTHELWVPVEDARQVNEAYGAGRTLLVPREDAPRQAAFAIEPVEETWIEIERGSMRPPASEPMHPVVVLPAR